MEQVKVELESHKLNGGLDVKITLEGDTDMPSWNHDLKLKAVIALLESVDYKEFADSEDKHFEYFKYLEQIEETIKSLREI